GGPPHPLRRPLRGEHRWAGRAQHHLSAAVHRGRRCAARLRHGSARAHLLAGEIGHMISDESPSARTCRCGRRGCLETIASKGAVTEAWQRTAGADADLDHLAAALADRDPRALELLTALAATVGRVLGIAALVTDPDEIVLAGEVGTLLEPVLPALRDAVCRQCLVGADLVVRRGETAH